MASLKEIRRNGKIVSYRIRCCVGRDKVGKQVFKSTTWYAPEEATQSKIEKLVHKYADEWEMEVKKEYQNQLQAESKGIPYQVPDEKRQDDFGSFVDEVWIPLHVMSGNNKTATVMFYLNNVKLIKEYFKNVVLQNISAWDIQKFLIYLQTEYISVHGRSLSAKTTHHIYATLNLIFGYAEKQEIIVKNPM